MLRYLPFLLVLAVWIYAFIDVLNTPEKEVRHLPKVVWVIIVLLFGEVLLGPIAWFVTGKKRHAPGAGGGRTRWVAPDDNPEFLKSLKEEDPDDKKRDKGTEG
ncbi:PLD nuclease N-terminal domain-containing protein [Streptomyces sp. NPDC018029]|uniref:PLD nuclease N-terminal domain-containing protein n=1 Tax=Streptomyces sp. NPDC018029 TaxID=3365032 RepID=UPI0037A462C5